MSRKLIALLSALSLIFSFSVLPVAADHPAPSKDQPEVVPGNPDCADVYGSGDFVFEFKLEPVASGTYPYSFDGISGTIVLTVNNDKTFNYEITGNGAAVGVIVKGGPDGNWYDYSPGSETSDQDLHAPRRNGGLFGLSHISFCMVEGTKDPSVATTSSETGTILPGTSVTDTATVTGVMGGPAPTGSVTFFLCQPSEVTAAGCPSPAGTQVGVAKTLGAAAGDPPSVSVTSDATTNTTTEGKYCWRAEYSGDSNYNAASHTNSDTECFTVDKATPNIATTSSETGNVLPGTSVTDTATVTGVGTTTPIGTVTFFLCQPTDVTVAGCPSGSGAQIGDPVNLAETTAPEASATSQATSNTTAEGKYCWRAEYSGDTVYEAASHTNSDTECFTVAKNTPGLTTDPWVYPNDSATFSGLAGTDDNDFGTVQFFLYQNDNTCAEGTHAFASAAITVTGNGDVLSTNNTTFQIDSTNEDTYYWQAVYGGDENNSAVTTACTAEQFVIDFTVAP